MSAPTLKKPPQNTNGTGSYLQDLARELGSSKGLDPIPPDQFLSYQDKRYKLPTIRLWAWMLAHTIRQRNKDVGKAYGRTAWAVDDEGKLLTIQDAAADLGIDEGNLRKAWRQLDSEGRVYKDGRKMRLSGNVELPPETLQEVATEEAGAPEENKKRSEVCTDPFPPYVLKQLKRLGDQTSKVVLDDVGGVRRAKAACVRTVIGVVRGIADQMEHNIFWSAGVKLQHAKQPSKPISEAETLFRSRCAAALEPLVSSFIESLTGATAPAATVTTASTAAPQETERPSQTKRSVHTRKAGLHTPENNSVQSPPDLAMPMPSLIQRTTEEEEKREDSSSSAVSSVTEQQKAEEEDRRPPYQIFKAEYPTGHFDEPKTKPAFGKKTKTQQREVIDRLRVYLECDRWKSDGGRWIPLASKWLETYEADPPPAVQKSQTAGAGTKSFKEDVMEEAAKRLQKGGHL